MSFIIEDLLNEIEQIKKERLIFKTCLQDIKSLVDDSGGDACIETVRKICEFALNKK